MSTHLQPQPSEIVPHLSQNSEFYCVWWTPKRRDCKALSQGLVRTVYGTGLSLERKPNRDSPKRIYTAVIDLLHEGHPGETRMKALGWLFVWWPGVDGYLENTVKECDQCQWTRHSPAQAPINPWEFPTPAWEQLHDAEFAGPFLGQMFLVMIDAYSKWLEVVPMSIYNTATSFMTIEKLRAIFATHGLPRMFVIDNGTQFTSTEFQSF